MEIVLGMSGYGLWPRDVKRSSGRAMYCRNDGTGRRCQNSGMAMSGV